MSRSCSGHTLPELLVAMALSMMLTGALVSANSLGLGSVRHLEHSRTVIARMQQSLRLLEQDLRRAYGLDCLAARAWVSDRMFSAVSEPVQRLTQPRVAGRDGQDDQWYPAVPWFSNPDLADGQSALQLLYADSASPVPAGSLEDNPNRLVYITNCTIAEVSRADNRVLDTMAHGMRVLPFQSVLYYLKPGGDSYTLYRQYLTASGNPRNEPLADGIDNLLIGYAEKNGPVSLEFKKAREVSDWDQIMAVYVRLDFTINEIAHSGSLLVERVN